MRRSLYKRERFFKTKAGTPKSPRFSFDIRVCLTEEEIQRQFFQALRATCLPEKFFYWFPLSVASWLRLCESKEYRNYTRSLSLAQDSAEAVLSQIRHRPVQWISLGCGQGTKEIPFLKACLQRGERLLYYPVDMSLPLLELACLRSLRLHVNTVGLKADFNRQGHLDSLPPPQGDTVRVVSLFGNTLEPLETGQIRTLWGKLMRRGDLFLVDGELFFGEETLAGYDHPTNRRFALAPLQSMGITEQDGTLRFQWERGRCLTHRLSKSFHFRRSKKLSISGETLTFKQGASIQMSPSYKCDRDQMRNLLERGGVLTVIGEYPSPDRRYLLWLCRKN